MILKRKKNKRNVFTGAATQQGTAYNLTFNIPSYNILIYS